MSSQSLNNQRWECLLTEAAAQPTGGARSFPSNTDIAQRYPYTLPDNEYREMFQHLALDAVANQQSQRNVVHMHSAGWLVPTHSPSSRPVFIAHSLLSAIWLLRQSLEGSALSPGTWEALVAAAEDLASGALCVADEVPSSAQVPSRSSPPVHKRAASPIPDLPSKRPCSHGDVPRSVVSLDLSDDDELAATPVLSEGGSPDEPVSATDGLVQQNYVTKITNNNRRAENRRAQRKADLRAKQGLVPPRETAPSRDRSAYGSISPQDEPLVSWILKQPVDDERDLYSSTAAPYDLALNMLGKARAVGNRTSQVSAAAFLRSWRAQGTPFAHSLREGRTPAPSQNRLQLARRGPSSGVESSALASAWTLCDQYEKELDVLHIKYRWAMSFLGKAYTEKIAYIRRRDAARSRDGKNRDGKGKVSTEAMDALLASVSASTGPRSRQRFRRRLHQALRWYEAARQLGWGMLCLMPHNLITNSWVENELRIRVWHVWLELVVKVNPIAYDASKALDLWLGSDGIAGGPIGGKATLYMETSVPATQVTEVEDSEDGQESDIESMSSQHSTRTLTFAETLGHLSLVELCKPTM